MATAESVKAKLQGLISLANTTTGKTDTDLTTAVNALIAGFGQGGSPGGTSGIYMAKITPAEDVGALEVEHNLGTTDILLAAAWAETFGDYQPESALTLAKFWAKTDINTQRQGNGFCPAYIWNATNSYATPQAPNTGSYETLTITDNSVKFPRAQSGTTTMYMAGVTYTVVVMAASAFSDMGV